MFLLRMFVYLLFKVCSKCVSFEYTHITQDSGYIFLYENTCTMRFCGMYATYFAKALLEQQEKLTNETGRRFQSHHQHKPSCAYFIPCLVYCE